MKVKIMSKNRFEQSGVISKALDFGAVARDGDYGPVEGKTAVVIDTSKGRTPAILLSRRDFTPTKRPYDLVLSTSEFLSMCNAPWEIAAANGSSVRQEPTRVIAKYVEVESGVCAQETLKVVDCVVHTQERIAWKTLGLPFLLDNGVSVVMDGETPYMIDTLRNTAKELTAEQAATTAKKSLLAGEKNVWVKYAQEFNLFDNVKLAKDADDDE